MHAFLSPLLRLKVIPVTAMVLRPHFNDMEYKLRPGMITLTWTSMNIDTYKGQVDDDAVVVVARAAGYLCLSPSCARWWSGDASGTGYEAEKIRFITFILATHDLRKLERSS